MARGSEDGAARYANGNSSHEQIEPTLSPWILELILRFTLLDGTALDLAGLARRPLTLPAQ